MPTYNFSALRDGQAISFTPTSDVLRFDQYVIAAADVRVALVGTDTRIQILSGSYAGKDILLLDTTPAELSRWNVTFADGSRLILGDGLSSTANDTAGNTLVGTSGRDHLSGLGGNDTLRAGSGDDYLDGGTGADYMDGGTGNDTYLATSGDVLIDAGGIDTVTSTVSWTLGNAFEHLTLLRSSSINGTGNEGNNLIVGNSGSNRLDGRGGNDQLHGNGGNDVMYGGVGNDILFGDTGDDRVYGNDGTDHLQGDYGNDVVDGGAHADFVSGGAGNDSLSGSSGNDNIRGDEGSDRLSGGSESDKLFGGPGRDTLTGGTGRDFFVWWEDFDGVGADLITDFASRTDEIELRPASPDAVHSALITNDPRFYAAFGATRGHDSTDRVIYDRSTGNLYYDLDGSGSAASQLVFTLAGAPTVVATDITLIA